MDRFKFSRYACHGHASGMHIGPEFQTSDGAMSCTMDQYILIHGTRALVYTWACDRT
jgi:hypothetical protein